MNIVTNNAFNTYSAAQNTAIMNTAKTAAASESSEAVKTAANVDTLEYSTTASDTKALGLYENIAKKACVDVANKIMAVSASKSTSGELSYLNVVRARAAENAGVEFGANGSPVITSQYDAKAYQQAYKEIEAKFWCQTGGWWEDEGITGSNRCSYAAIATCASINLGATVKPNEVNYGCKGFLSDAVARGRKNYSGSQYFSTCNVKAQKHYTFSNEKDILAAINNELSNNRSVVVKTDFAGEHWVTVTGTVDGKPAESFDDLIGVDPWCNADNPNNPTQSNYYDADNRECSGVFKLSEHEGQGFHHTYAIFAIA